MKRLLCWLFGHRLTWILHGAHGVPVPACRRCKREMGVPDTGASAKA